MYNFCAALKTRTCIVGKCHLVVLQVSFWQCNISTLWMWAFHGQHFVFSRRINPIYAHHGSKIKMQRPDEKYDTFPNNSVSRARLLQACKWHSIRAMRGRFSPLIEVTWRDAKWPQEGAATLQDSKLNFSLLCVFSLEHCWPTHINHLYTLYEAVIMVYHTLQMHYSSPILTRLTYIITCGRMHYICMCMYIMAYMCIYTDIHVTDLFMYFAYIHVLIYPYICCIFFCVCVGGAECENESVGYEIMMKLLLGWFGGHYNPALRELFSYSWLRLTFI